MRERLAFTSYLVPRDLHTARVVVKWGDMPLDLNAWVVFKKSSGWILPDDGLRCMGGIGDIIEGGGVYHGCQESVIPRSLSEQSLVCLSFLNAPSGVLRRRQPHQYVLRRLGCTQHVRKIFSQTCRGYKAFCNGLYQVACSTRLHLLLRNIFRLLSFSVGVNSARLVWPWASEAFDALCRRMLRLDTNKNSSIVDSCALTSTCLCDCTDFKMPLRCACSRNVVKSFPSSLMVLIGANCTEHVCAG